MHGPCPPAAARCKGESPVVADAVAFVEADRWRRKRTHWASPSSAARCRAVRPRRSGKSRLRLRPPLSARSNMCFTTSGAYSPDMHARCSAVRPSSSTASGFAPWFINVVIPSKYAPPAARCNAVRPAVLRVLMSAPPASSCPTWPYVYEVAHSSSTQNGERRRRRRR